MGDDEDGDKKLGTWGPGPQGWELLGVTPGRWVCPCPHGSLVALWWWPSLVEGIVALYYPEDSDVAEDNELQDWVGEIFTYAVLGNEKTGRGRGDGHGDSYGHGDGHGQGDGDVHGRGHIVVMIMHGDGDHQGHRHGHTTVTIMMVITAVVMAMVTSWSWPWSWSHHHGRGHMVAVVTPQ